MKKWLLVILLLGSVCPAHALTIDQMYISTFGHYNQTYDPTGYASQQSFMIFGQADYYIGTPSDLRFQFHPATHLSDDFPAEVKPQTGPGLFCGVERPADFLLLPACQTGPVIGYDQG